MRGLVRAGVLAVGVSVAAAGAAEARIVHDGSCPSRFASDVSAPGRHTHTCISPRRIVHDSRCSSGLRSTDPSAPGCVPTYELRRNIHGLHGRSPRQQRIVHD